MSPERRAAAEILMGLLKWPWSVCYILIFHSCCWQKGGILSTISKIQMSRTILVFQFSVKQGAWRPPCILQVTYKIIALSRSAGWTLVLELSLTSVVDL